MVDTTFPEPLVPSLGLDAGIYVTDTLKHYDYTEDLPNDTIDWEFTLGAANVRMFRRAFDALFDKLVSVPQPGGSGPPFDHLDVIVEPRIEAFEFSLPRQSRSDQYAVWIRYQLRLYRPDGTFITDWPVSAYGQADARMMRGGTAMNAAVVRALRDAIANIVIGFPQEPKIQAALFPDAAPATGAAPAELTGETAPAAAPRAPPEPAAEPPPADAGDTGEIRS